MIYEALPAEADVENAPMATKGSKRIEKLLLLLSYLVRFAFFALRLSVVKVVTIDILVLCDDPLANMLHQTVFTLVVVDGFVLGLVSIAIVLLLALNSGEDTDDAIHRAYKVIGIVDVLSTVYIFGQVWYHYTHDTLPLYPEFYLDPFESLECSFKSPMIGPELAYLNVAFKTEAFVLLVSVVLAFLVSCTHLLGLIVDCFHRRSRWEKTWGKFVV